MTDTNDPGASQAASPTRTFVRKHKSTNKRPKWRHMFYGYVIDQEFARQRGSAAYGPAETDDDMRQFESQYTLKLSGDCLRVWRRSRLRVVDLGDVLANCISLAENTSESAMKLPPKEIIDKIKLTLETEEEPRWHRVYA